MTEPRAHADAIMAARRHLLAHLGAPRQAQEGVLDAVLRANAGTEFGERHGLPAVRDLDDFRRATPIRTHEELMPWIERTIAGERNVLTADDPVVYFSSSGSTGREKHIPVTRTFLRTCFLPFYLASFARVLDLHPRALSEPEAVLNLWQDPNGRIERTAGGHPHIGPSQLDLRAFSEDLRSAASHASGPETFGEEPMAGPGAQAPWGRLPDRFADADPWERAYLRVRLAAASPDVRGVIGVNPAIIAALPYQLEQWWPRIADEIRAGTLGGAPHTSPDPARAEEIERLADRFGTVRPGHLWPRLELIVTWNTALSSLYLPRVRERFGVDVDVLTAPIASCEGPVGVPIDRHPTAGPLFTPGCLYEFVPAEEALAPDSRTLLADELEVGREYHLVLTHVGGLYRCATTDVVRVVDRVELTPRVEYAGRNIVRDAAGERLGEPDVVRALRAALADVGLEARNATCRLADGADGADGADDAGGADGAGGAGGAGTGGPPRYELALAATGAPTAAEIDALGRALDIRLGQECDGYRRARDAGRLDAVRVVPTHPDAFLREWERRIRAGERPPRVKDRVFLPDPRAWRRITADAGAATETVALVGAR